MKKIIFEKNINKVLYLQIADYFSKHIESGGYFHNDRLPSINFFSSKYQVSRDTVEKAYKLLVANGYARAVVGKGYFVDWSRQSKLNVLFIMNKLSSYKKIVYYSFLEGLPDNTNVDLRIHHYDPGLLTEILKNNMSKYHYYVIMPHFFSSLSPAIGKKVLGLVPGEQLLLLDKRVIGFDCMRCVYQDFKNDIYDGLTSAIDPLRKYSTIVLVFPDNSHHPTGIINGVRRFCKLQQKVFKQVSGLKPIEVSKGAAYIFVEEDDLSNFIKQIRQTDLVLGKDIGIISFNETVFKELLDITVITTDFAKMGRSAADMILHNRLGTVRNDFSFIQRKSL